MFVARGLVFVVSLGLVGLVGCAAPNDEEGADSTDNALTGRVTVGRVLETQTEGLRLRRTASRDNTNNIVGLLPKGTKVKILAASQSDGFYQVEVQDPAVRKTLSTTKGWVYGEYLSGEAEEPQDPDVSLTGTWDEPTRMRAKLVVSDCAGLKDDQGHALAPTLDDAIAGRSAYAAIAIDANTFSYGMKATIDEVDATSGKKIKFKVLKTATSSPSGPYTVTICTRSGTAPALATADGSVDVAVYAYW